MSDLTIYQGDDYATADGLQLIWNDTADDWPVITGAAVSLLVCGIVHAGAVVSATQVKVDLTKAQTALLTPGEVQYWVYAVPAASSRHITLANGTVEIKAGA